MQKSINHYMRSLHRDIGFLVIGLTIIYSISGIVLIYRKSDFLKKERLIEVQLSPNLSERELGSELRKRNFKALKEEGDLIIFNSGTYNKSTGEARYTEKSLPEVIKKFNGLHKASNKSKVYWATTTYGILLLFLAISSFWMFKPKSKQFKRGIIFSAAGLIIAIVLILL